MQFFANSNFASRHQRQSFKTNSAAMREMTPMRAIALCALLMGGMMSSSAMAIDVPATYQEACAACHDSGALNAPKTGDKAKWEALKKQKGMPALVNSVKTGMRQMPAGGLCSSCSDQDYRALIDYMSK